MAKVLSYRHVPSLGSLAALQILSFVLTIGFFVAAMFTYSSSGNNNDAYAYFGLSLVSFSVLRHVHKKFYYWYQEVLDGGRVYRKSLKKFWFFTRYYIHVKGATRVGTCETEEKKVPRYAYEDLDLGSGKKYYFQHPISKR